MEITHNAAKISLYATIHCALLNSFTSNMNLTFLTFFSKIAQNQFLEKYSRI